MIRPLRARHRRMVVAVGVVAGLLLVLGLLARRPVPTQAALPLRAASQKDGSQEVGFGRLGVRATLGRDADGSVLLELGAAWPLDDALVGVYWAPGRPADLARLPERSYWLGLYGGRAQTYRLPPRSAAVDGSVLLYGLNRHQVLDAAPIPVRRSADARHSPS